MATLRWTAYQGGTVKARVNRETGRPEHDPTGGTFAQRVSAFNRKAAARSLRETYKVTEAWTKERPSSRFRVRLWTPENRPDCYVQPNPRNPWQRGPDGKKGRGKRTPESCAVELYKLGVGAGQLRFRGA